MRKLALAVLAGAMVAGTPALADWDRTRWGMTRAEALAAYPQATQTAAANMLRMQGSFAYAGRTFSVAGLRFDEEGRLSEVLFLPDPGTGPSLRADLTRAFGEGR